VGRWWEAPACRARERARSRAGRLGSQVGALGLFTRYSGAGGHFQKRTAGKEDPTLHHSHGLIKEPESQSGGGGKGLDRGLQWAALPPCPTISGESTSPGCTANTSTCDAQGGARAS
jgi:hypothetical protein